MFLGGTNCFSFEIIFVAKLLTAFKDFHFGHSDFLIYFTVLAKQDTLILVVNFIFRFEVDFIFILINLA